MTATLPPPVSDAPQPALRQPRPHVARDTVETILEGVPAWRSVLELCKPTISLMVLVSVAVGYALASAVHGVSFSLFRLLVAFVGVAMATSAAAILNQVIEHRTDAMMPRTAARPIPSGRVSVAEAMALAMVLGSWGIALLAVAVHPLCAASTAFTLAAYAFVYTPMKPRSAWATIVGTVPGAMPPVLGAAATGTLGLDAAALFLLLALWQVPHFLAIAWKYRDQYARAGLKMLPPRDADGRKTGVLAAFTGMLLVPLSLSLPSLAGTSWIAAAAVALVSGWYAMRAVAFAVDRCPRSAVRLLVASFLHLPAALAIIAIDVLLR